MEKKNTRKEQNEKGQNMKDENWRFEGYDGDPPPMIPNNFFDDLMPELTHPELIVMLAAFRIHDNIRRENGPFTLEELEQITRQSSREVEEGVQGLLEIGALKRDGDAYDIRYVES